jgi:septum site-determining protein MinD
MSAQKAARFRSYIVTSCKGGIGKSTVSANIAASLCGLGHRVLTVDCDFSNRSLDLIFGCADKVVNDITDLALGRTSPEQTVIEVPGRRNLFFVPAPPVCRDLFTTEQLGDAVARAARAFDCDIVFIDTPGAADWILPVVAPVADTALIVASHMPTSVRGAEKTGYFLESLGVTEQYLIVNRFDMKKVRSGERPGLTALIDQTKVRLIGVIPDSRQLELAQEKGLLASDFKGKGDLSAAAFDETARRMCGDRLPIMSFLPERKRRMLLSR